MVGLKRRAVAYYQHDRNLYAAARPFAIYSEIRCSGDRHFHYWRIFLRDGNISAHRAMACIGHTPSLSVNGIGGMRDPEAA